MPAQVSWDFHRAAKAGFAELAEDAKTTKHPPVPQGDNRMRRLSGDLADLPGDPSLGGWEFWEAFLRDPLSLNVAKLKEAMLAVRLKVKLTVSARHVCGPG